MYIRVSQCNTCNHVDAIVINTFQPMWGCKYILCVHSYLHVACIYVTIYAYYELAKSWRSELAFLTDFPVLGIMGDVLVKQSHPNNGS